MQLRFLGTPYSANDISIETAELNTNGKYRGHHVSFRHAQPQAPDAAVALRYRGIAYLR